MVVIQRRDRVGQQCWPCYRARRGHGRCRRKHGQRRRNGTRCCHRAALSYLNRIEPALQRPITKRAPPRQVASMAPDNSRWSNLWLALRSILWTVLMPGVVAGYIPWRFYGVAHVHLTPLNPVHILALVMLGLGAALLSACIWEFARSGRGTLSPVDPPRELVVRGLYRSVRNPMYLSVTMIVLGEVLLAGSRTLFIYWVVFFSAANLFVI